eukprot:1115322-Rhodomonas_salina.3
MHWMRGAARGWNKPPRRNVGDGIGPVLAWPSEAAWQVDWTGQCHVQSAMQRHCGRDHSAHGTLPAAQ